MTALLIALIFTSVDCGGNTITKSYDGRYLVCDDWTAEHMESGCAYMSERDFVDNYFDDGNRDDILKCKPIYLDITEINN